MNELKRLLKPLYHNLLLLCCVLQRTIFAPFYALKIPFNKNIIIESNVRFYNNTRVIYYDGSMKVGSNTEICCFSKFIIEGGKLQIGNNCLLGEYGIYNVFADLIIGNNVMTADRVSFVTNIHDYKDIITPIKRQTSTSDLIIIGDGTWIGMNVTILAGSYIGKNCVVAAHCVVKGIYPDYCVIGGIPSRIIKKYNDLTEKWEKEEMRVYEDG